MAKADVYKKQLTELEKELGKAEGKVADLTSEYYELENLKNSEIAELEAKNELLEAQITKMKCFLDRYLSWYKNNSCSINTLATDAEEILNELKGVSMIDSFDLRPYMNRLKAVQENVDIESAHAEADGVLCDLLTALGYKKLIDEYHEVPKWYA